MQLQQLSWVAGATGNRKTSKNAGAYVKETIDEFVEKSFVPCANKVTVQQARANVRTRHTLAGADQAYTDGNRRVL